MHKGSCLCGDVTYEINQNLDFVVNCHCQYCRRAHGSPYVTVLGMKRENFKLIKGEDRLSEFKVGAGGRYFCQSCGTRVYNVPPMPSMVSVITATLDEPDIAKPIANVNVESKSDLTTLGDEIPSYDGQLSQDDIIYLYNRFLKKD